MVSFNSLTLMLFTKCLKFVDHIERSVSVITEGFTAANVAENMS